MKRRDFLRTGAIAAGGAIVASSAAAESPEQASGKRRFKLKYAPHFGMFKHSASNELTDQLKFASDQGFTAWEDNGMKGRPVEIQEKIAKTMESLEMEMGVSSPRPPSPTSRLPRRMTTNGGHPERHPGQR